MEFFDVADQERKLVNIAKNLIEKRRSELSGVGAALITSTGKIFQGVNIDIDSSSPCSICAEYAAIGTMVSEGERMIEAIVAVNYKGQVIPPCGKCRQFISEFGNPYVILEVDSSLKKSRLSDLYPIPFS